MRSWSRRFRRGTATYVVTVSILAAVPVLDDGPIGQVLYFAAWALTLPTGVLIYPALWINLILVGSLGLGDDVTLTVTSVSLVVVFGASAAVNALLARSLWSSMRSGRQRKGGSYPP